MDSLYDFLRTFFTYEENWHPDFVPVWNRVRSEKLPGYCDPQFLYPQLELHASLSMYYRDQHIPVLVLHVPDREIVKTSGKRTMGNLLDCNYVLYGIYLNVIAYLENLPHGKLQLISGPNPDFIHPILYKKEISEYVVKQRSQRLSQKESEVKETGQAALF